MKESKPRDIAGVLKHLKKSGIPYERIAYELGVGWPTIKAWEAGRRNPKKSALRQIEHLYSVKIL